MYRSEIYSTEEYYNKLLDRFNNGGQIWLIERTDTNEFLSLSFQTYKTNEPFIHNEAWSGTVSLSEVLRGFLEKKDAEHDIKFLNLKEGGCKCCGHGSQEISVRICDHIFVPQK